MAQIIPAIMPKTLADVREHVELIKDAVKTVQLDIMDGSFVKAKSWPYIKRDDYFDAIVRGDEGMPFWEDMNYEIDLMVADSFDAAEHWVRAGAHRILFHIESFHSFKNNKDIAEDVRKALAYKNDFTEIGLAIGIDTPLKIIEPFLSEISSLQCMGIRQIGFQGQPLDERILERLARLRVLAPELPLSVDGGVTFDNAHDLIHAGATRLVSGSAVFEDVNPADAIERLGH